MNNMIPLRENFYKKAGGKLMRENKEGMNKDFKSTINDQGMKDVSSTEYGLESVAEGCDFAEGEKEKPPECGGM
ncbi:hypothetical protein CHI10_18855 [Bacillus sp. 7894-2]|nr:hypothetical protein CHI10_18855 [Bacillus sp. 7894-2]